MSSIIYETFSWTYFLVAVIGLLVIGFLIFGYFYQDQAFQIFYYSGLESRLNKKCEQEKTTLEEGAKEILQETIDSKNKEISDLQTKLQDQVTQGKISQDQAISELKTALQTQKEAAEKTAKDLQAIIDASAQKVKQLETDIDKKINVPTPWVCGINGLMAPVRVNADKTVECMSNNGFDCQWSNDYASCQTKINTLKDTYTKPNICNETTYNTEGHFCKIAKAAYGI